MVKKLILVILLLSAFIYVGCQDTPEAPKQDASKSSQSSQDNQNTGST